MKANSFIFEIVGIGTRKNGVSRKNNKPYDFTPVSLLYEAPGVTGHLAITLNLLPEDISAIQSATSFSVGGIFQAFAVEDYFRRLKLFMISPVSF